MTVSISNMAQVWMSNTNTYNGIAMSISTLGYGANTFSRVLKLNVDGNTKFDIDGNGTVFAANTVSDKIGDLRILPINAQTSSYVLKTTDVGKVVSITTGGVTVPPSVFSAGQAATIFNYSGSNQTITNNNVTLYLAGQALTGNRTLAQYGVATVLCVAANTFVISGAGLT